LCKLPIKILINMLSMRDGCISPSFVIEG
jgi:hypothetical protein